MRFRISGTDGQYHVYSIAVSERARDELGAQGLPHWRIADGKITDASTGSEIIITSGADDAAGAFHDFDAVEVFRDGTVFRYYDDSSGDNVFFITEKCNSNCIMCPSPEGSRRSGELWSAEQLILMASHIPTDAPHFTITGGEPFMAGRQIFDFFRYLRERFPESEFLILTNGRAMAIPSYIRLLGETVPYNAMFGIPLHASDAALHDAITQAKGSFAQTVTGIKNLLYLGMAVEIRIVVSRLNVSDLEMLAYFIVREFPGVDHVSIMAMEMTGSAYVNREQVWMPYAVSFPFVKKAVDVLIRNAVNVRLYNYPLCTVMPEYWTLCRKSISERKIRFFEGCGSCKVRDACGGVFAGTRLLEEQEIRAVV